ncbi:MAG: 1-acyl-sn-glycerol-3-phosphate acyltransferase [Candidatus Omnitrophota bacterium]
MVYLIIKFSSLIFFKLYLGFKVYGKENIPKKDAFILAANHASYIDPLLLAASFHRPLHFMARDRILKAGMK